MSPSFVLQRWVTIGDAAAFAGTTPRAVRHYHAIGLLPEPERGGDDRRRYGYDDVLQLLWVRRTADAGIPLDDVRSAFTDAAAAGDDDGGEDGGGVQDVDDVLERLEGKLAAQEALLQRQRRAVQLVRRRGSRAGLLSDVVAGRLDDLPEGTLRQADLDGLLVAERIFGPLGAAVRATRIIALATHPELRAESDRVEAAEEALDDGVAVDDPRVARVAAQRHAVELALDAVIEHSGLARSEEAILDDWEAEHPVTDGDRGRGGASAVHLAGRMPLDLPPARLRCVELAEELATHDALAP